MQAALSHYRILEQIGQGGMGVVYRAHDEHLDCDVALKVLPAGKLTDDAARKRFRKEALTLSKLNHPNIAVVHDFDTQDGTDFLVEELIPGMSLNEMLFSGPLAEREIINLGSQLADGLAAAHEQGVVHRDLKPANIRVTPDARLKILDFGLAKVMSNPAAGSGTDITASLTETQTVSGTFPYMAPEQLLNEKLDARSDIWSAGCVLYEMATGLRPFMGSGPMLTEAILHQPPAPPSRLNHKIAPSLDAILLKCLDKQPENRYQSAKELAVDLKRLLTHETQSSPATHASSIRPRTLALLGIVLVVLLGVLGYFAVKPKSKRGSPAGKIMLAVLPVENLGGNPEQEYFSDGLTEELIARLGTLQPKRLGVIARTSAMRYKKTDKSIAEIGRELGVDYVLESSVRRDSDRARITVQLIQVSDQTQLWAESYERELASVLALQSEVSQRVARSLALELLPAEQTRLVQVRTINPQAHDFYLKGRYYWYRRTPADIQRATEYFKKAVSLDPNYALAYAGLADSYGLYSLYEIASARDSFPLARTAATRALEIDAQLVEAQTSMAFVAFYYDWDWAAAEAQLKHILEIRPDYAIARQWHAEYLSAMGRHQEARTEISRARESDPLSPLLWTMAGYIDLYGHRYDEAVEECRATLRLAPDYALAYLIMGRAYAAKGSYAQAEGAVRRAVPVGQMESSLDLALIAAKLGKTAEAEQIVRQVLTSSPVGYPSPAQVAFVYAARGDRDQALRWLEKAYQERDPTLIRMRVDTRFDPLRSDPRFEDLLNRMNFPP